MPNKTNNPGRNRTLQKGMVLITTQTAKSRPNPQKRKRNSSQLRGNLQTALVLSGAQGSRSRITNRMRPSMSQTEKRYMLAISSPFHPDAMGATVPGLGSRGTQTLCVRWKSIISFPTAGNTVTTFPMGFVPNPSLFGYILGSGGSTTTLPSMFTTEGTMQLNSTSYPGIPGVSIDQNNGLNRPLLSNFFTTFRVVAGGVRINSLTSVSNNTFTLSTYQTPAIQSNVPYQVYSGYSNLTNSASPDFVGTMSGGQVSNLFFGADFTSASAGNLVNSRRSYTGFEIQDSPLTLSFQPNNPTAHLFRESAGTGSTLGSGTGATIFGDEFAVDATTALASTPASTGDSDLTNNEGWDGVLVYMTIPPSATGGASNTPIEVEFVLHLEGVPVYNSSSASFTYMSDRPKDFIPPKSTMEHLVGYARGAFDYAMTHPRLMNGMADMIMASGGVRNYAARNSLRLGYQTGEF